MPDFDRPSRNPLDTSDVNPATPTATPGKSTLSAGALPRTSHELVSHTQPKSAFRTPEDEKPLDWTRIIHPTPPQSPFQIRNVMPRDECPKASHSEFERPASHHQDTGRRLAQGSDPSILITDSKRAWRQDCWQAYREAVTPLQQIQVSVVGDIDRYYKAQNDHQLQALGLVMDKGFRGDLSKLASSQQVPHRGGPTVDSLFRGDNSLDVTATDSQAVAEVAKGSADAAFLQVIRADSKLKAALAEVNSAAHSCAAANDRLKAAQLAIEGAEAQREVAAATAEIAELKEGAEHIKSAVEFLDDAPAKIIELAKKGLEQVSHLGSACALILQTFPIAGLAAAEAKLVQAQSKVVTVENERLHREFNAARETSLATMSHIVSTKDNLAAAMTARRLVYDAAGTEVAKVSGNNKLAGFIGAIPIVEVMVASTLNIAEKTRGSCPVYTEPAGVGFAIAVAAREETAFNLPLAASEMGYMHVYMGEVHNDWAARLTALRAVAEEMAGTRPSGEES